ncbi:UNVERIFIED_CONTAM: hypothetical protein GTU68_048384 [Idotea baltica]|nr:hypothetical protein [Idotea baltica]
MWPKAWSLWSPRSTCIATWLPGTSCCMRMGPLKSLTSDSLSRWTRISRRVRIRDGTLVRIHARRDARKRPGIIRSLKSGSSPSSGRPRKLSRIM